MICFCGYCRLFRQKMLWAQVFCPKDVVGTSLLSKRWRLLWKLMPILEYDDSNHIGDYKIFSQFVYRSLLSNKAPVLDKFELSVGSDCPCVDIGLWIDNTVSRRVRDLEIEIRSIKEEFVSMPSSLYNSDTLVALRLIDFVLLNAPLSVCLPSLKILSLECVNYKDDVTLPRLLSGCPNLEDLLVERCEGDTTMNSIIVVPSLQILTLIDTCSGKCDRNVIDAPSLKYLTITDNVVYNSRQIENMPKLDEANVEISHGVTHEFLRALTSARRLSLCLSLSEVMNPCGMIFNQLVHLDLYTIDEGWWDLLARMLQDSPNLQTLKLINKHDSNCSAKEIPSDWNLPSSVPECLLFTLEAFTWTGYKGRQGDIKMATYVLKNAACLKTATFSPDNNDVGEKYQMIKDLAYVARASTSSQLLFD